MLDSCVFPFVIMHFRHDLRDGIVSLLAIRLDLDGYISSVGR